MTKIAIEIKDCSACPFLKRTNQWSSDGWDKMEDWECSKMIPQKKIAGSVEWFDKIEIPEWCPIKI